MGDLEVRLRAELRRRAHEFSASVDLGDRIRARVRERRRQRLAVVGVLSAALVAVAATGVSLARPLDRPTTRIGDDREVQSAPSTEPGGGASDDAGSATSEPPPSSTTTDDDATTPRPPTTASPAGPSVGPATPLTRAGIGPIRAGMTLREAEAAAGVTLVPGPSMGPGSTCTTARIDGLDLWLVVSLSGDPGEDPLDGVIGSVQGGTRTVEGVAVGDAAADLDAVYGPPTRTLDYPYLPNGRVLVYESGGFAYSVTTDGVTVTELESGDPAWVANLEGCA
ncbi:MAG TPA: hypothetical protein VFZ77_09070 [Acidimicrobiales bacterium]